MDAIDPLGDGLLDGLGELTLDDLRARRAACQDVETQISYVRRLCQGRLDIVRHERARRAAGGADPGDLVAELTEALADRITSPGNGHLATELEPEDVDPALLAALDEVAPPAALSDPHALADADLAVAETALEGFEHELSARRKALFGRIDVLQDELVRRYREGEASVDTLLTNGAEG